VPFVLFYFWAARYERRTEAHGLMTNMLAAEEV
jgi:hypothetical protein